MPAAAACTAAIASSVSSSAGDRKSTRLNSSHSQISYADFCLNKTQIRIETKNDDHQATQILFGPYLTSSGVFELWKCGVAGFGAFAGALSLNALANPGRRLLI